MKHITIGPRYECAVAATKYEAEYVISIQDFEDIKNDIEPTPKGVGYLKHRHFFFDDVTDDVPIRYSSRDCDLIRNHMPDSQDVIEILEFFKKIPDDSRIYIHCYAGVSRSTAMAFILFCHQLGEGKEAEAMERTEIAAPYGGIWPNPLIVELGDKLLKRDGKMVEAVKAWKAKVLYDVNERNSDRMTPEKINEHIRKLFGDAHVKMDNVTDWEQTQKDLKIDEN